MLEGREGVVR
jgi:hypothetical protein